MTICGISIALAKLVPSQRARLYVSNHSSLECLIQDWNTAVGPEGRPGLHTVTDCDHTHNQHEQSKFMTEVLSDAKQLLQQMQIFQSQKPNDKNKSESAVRWRAAVSQGKRLVCFSHTVHMSRPWMLLKDRLSSQYLFKWLHQPLLSQSQKQVSNNKI